MLLVAIILVGGSFYGGMKYAQAKGVVVNRNSPMAGQFRAGQGIGGMRNGQGAGVTVGQILSNDNTSLTIKLPDGGSKIVFYNNSTNITKNTPGVSGDLKVNENVIVNGVANSDGSINAQSIQLGSLMRFGQGQNRFGSTTISQ